MIGRVPVRHASSRSWVCLWSDCLDSRSLARAGEPAELLFYRLLAIAGEQGRDGVVVGSAADLAWRLRGRDDDIAERLLALESVGCIVVRGDEIEIVGWAARQPAESEAERSRRRREAGYVATTTSDRTDRTDRVTTGSRPGHDQHDDRVTTGSHRPDASGLEESRGEESRVERDSSLRSLSRQKRRPPADKRIPADWQPTDELRQLAAERRVDLATEIAKLRDHEFARPRRDWDAVARNWVRSARPTTHYDNPGNLPIGIATAKTQRTLAALEQYRAAKAGENQ